MSPRIYVADLAAYNAGILHGVWIELEDKSVDDVSAEVGEMLAVGTSRYAYQTLSNNHEEWAIHDYEGFGPLEISEYEGFARLVDLAEGINEHGEAFAHFVSHFGLPSDVALTEFDDAYIGDTSVRDYAYDLADELMDSEQLPQDSILRRYFDYDQFARDLELSGDVVDAGRYLFHGNW